MLIYEKDNKLNISFENNMEDTDIQIGKDEVKIGESTISENNVLPETTPEDVGKVPTVQEDGSYALANAGGTEPFVVMFYLSQPGDIPACNRTLNEISAAYSAGKDIKFRYGEYVDDELIDSGFNPCVENFSFEPDGGGVVAVFQVANVFRNEFDVYDCGINEDDGNDRVNIERKYYSLQAIN